MIFLLKPIAERFPVPSGNQKWLAGKSRADSDLEGLQPKPDVRHFPGAPFGEPVLWKMLRSEHGCLHPKPEALDLRLELLGREYFRARPLAVAPVATTSRTDFIKRTQSRTKRNHLEYRLAKYGTLRFQSSLGWRQCREFAQSPDFDLGIQF
jgi:hypothetical protein